MLHQIKVPQNPSASEMLCDVIQSLKKISHTHTHTSIRGKAGKSRQTQMYFQFCLDKKILLMERKSDLAVSFSEVYVPFY